MKRIFAAERARNEIITRPVFRRENAYKILPFGIIKKAYMAFFNALQVCVVVLYAAEDAFFDAFGLRFVVADPEKARNFYPHKDHPC